MRDERNPDEYARRGGDSAAKRRYKAELKKLCADAERDLAWDDLAKFIDELNAQYQGFTEKIRTRKIGRYVLR